MAGTGATSRELRDRGLADVGDFELDIESRATFLERLAAPEAATARLELENLVYADFVGTVERGAIVNLEADFPPNLSIELRERRTGTKAGRRRPVDAADHGVVRQHGFSGQAVDGIPADRTDRR